MIKRLNRIKPAADKRALIFIAGLIWICSGIMLISFSYNWLQETQNINYWLIAVISFALSLLIHHFGFLKIVDINLRRLLPAKEKKCIFSFMDWKSYINVVVMAVTGIFIRNSSIPKIYLSIGYAAIGLALILSSLRYFRILFFHLGKNA
ncbi:MAG: hypothetical protein ABIK92_14755 [Pseudomonadota bacterium]